MRSAAEITAQRGLGALSKSQQVNRSAGFFDSRLTPTEGTDLSSSSSSSSKKLSPII
jgi:hypothetical protein